MASGSTLGPLIGAVVGGIVGSIIPGVGTSIGIAAGSLLGGLAGGLYDYSTAKDQFQEQQSLDDLKLQSSTFGRVIPQVWGVFSVAGNVIWATDKVEHEERTSKSAGKGGGPKQVTVTKTYTISYAIALADTRITGPINHIKRAWRDTTLIVGGFGAVLPDNWTFYSGTSTQSPDPLMESTEGVGNVPGYHYLAYVVIEDDQLGQSGRTPNYTFELSQNLDQQGQPLATVVEDICEACGIAGATLDVDDLSSGSVNMALVSIQAGRAPLEQLSQAFRFYGLESGTTYKFRERGSGSVVATITEDDLAAGEDRHAETSLEVTRAHELELPRQLSVTFLDPAQDYQENTQRAQLDLPDGAIDTPRNISLTLGLSATDAKQLAEELLAEAWAQREVFRGTLGMAYAYLEPGDRITVTARGIEYGLVLTETSFGRPGIMEFQARVDAAYIRNMVVGSPAVVTFPTQEPAVLDDTTPLLLNLPALDSNDTTVHYHVAYIGADDSWGGAALHRSADGGSTYQQIDSTSTEGITGTVALATASASWYVLDTATTISVVLEYGSLTSITDLALYNGGNRCLIGDEILGFGVATLTAPMTYTLTRLLRGRRGTEWAIAGHGANEDFVLLDTGVRTIPMVLADRYVERDFKAVTLGQAIADATAIQFTPTAASLNPWSVAGPDANLSGSDWVFTWRYRSRFAGDWVDSGGVGFDFDFLGFQVIIYTSNTYATVARTITTDGGNSMDAEAEKTETYTAAQQTTDFGSPQATIYYRIYSLTNNGASVATDLVGV